MKQYFYLFMLILMLCGCDKMHTVSVTDEDGNYLYSVDVSNGTTLSEIKKPLKDGYIFVNWTANGMDYDINTVINEDMTIVPVYVEEPTVVSGYTVSFDFGGEIKTQTIRSGEKVNRPKDPVKNGYIFSGWYSGMELYNFDTPVTKDILLVAKYLKKNVLVTFDLSGGSGILNIEIKRGDILDKPRDPTRDGYVFVNWMLDGKEYNFDTEVLDDVTLVAVWKEIEYVSVEFDTSGGIDMPRQVIEKGMKLVNINNPYKDGYTFKYWMINDQIFDIDTEIVEDIKLVAVYDKNDKE